MLGPMQPLIATLECVFDATVIGEEPAGGSGAVELASATEAGRTTLRGVAAK